MLLTFRNIDASPDDPVETWPLEGVITALERGGLSHRRRLAAAIKADPWGPVARNVLEALSVTEPYGVTPLMESVIAHAREQAADDEREQVAREVRSLISSSGLTAAEFAARLGTSASRLSTYSSGKVSPSAALMGADAPGVRPHAWCEQEPGAAITSGDFHDKRSPWPKSLWSDIDRPSPVVLAEHGGDQ